MRLSKAVTAMCLATLLEMSAQSLHAAAPRVCETLLIGDSLHVDPTANTKTQQKAVRLELENALSAWDNDQATIDQVVDAVSANLEAQGTPHEIVHKDKKTWVVTITPQNGNVSRLNKIAHAMWEKHKTKLEFNPLKLSAKKSRLASFLRPYPEHERTEGVVTLPVGSVVDPNGLDISLLHEIVHSNTIYRLRYRKPFAFYGRVVAVKSKGQAETERLPGSELIDKEGKAHVSKTYTRYFAFDEIEAYYVQVRGTRQTAEGTGKKLVGDERNSAVTRALKGIKLSRQAALFARTALDQIASSSIDVKFELLEEVVQAVFRMTVDGKRISMKIPLIKSAGLTDRGNMDFLAEQLRLLEETARERELAFFDALEFFSPKKAKKFARPN